MPGHEFEEILRDHDLLLRVDEKVKQIFSALDSRRQDLAMREARRDAEFTAYRIETEKRMADQDEEIESLRMSRAQIFGGAMAVSSIVGVIIKILWH